MKIKKKSSTKNGAYKRLFSYMKPYRGKLILAIILIMFANLAYALAPLFMGNATNFLAEILENGRAAQAGADFIMFLLLMGGAYGINSLLSYIGTCLMVAVTENTIYDLRKKVDYKLSKLPLNYYDTNSYGDILSRITNDVDTVSNSLQQSIYQISNAFFTIVIIFIIMLWNFTQKMVTI